MSTCEQWEQSEATIWCKHIFFPGCNYQHYTPKYWYSFCHNSLDDNDEVACADRSVQWSEQMEWDLRAKQRNKIIKEPSGAYVSRHGVAKDPTQHKDEVRLQADDQTPS